MIDSFIDKKGIYLIAGATAVIVFLIYLPVLGYGFINWDDPVYFYENTHIRSLDMEFFRWLATAVVSNNWHPLTMFSHAADYALFGPGPRGPHLTNIIFHSANTFLVAIVTYRLVDYGEPFLNSSGKARSAPAVLSAFIVALVFGLHPQHVESVAWISERKDLLCAFFYLLSMLAYISYVRAGTKKPIWFIAALLFCILALFSKPMAVSIPFVLLILDYYPFDRMTSASRVLLEKLPFLIIAIIFSVITLLTQKGGSTHGLSFADLPVRVGQALTAYAFYIYKFLWPIGLSPLYPSPLTSIFALYFAVIIIAVIIVLGIITARKFNQQKLALVTSTYFVITLAPVVGLIKVGSQGAADRYMYLPSIAPAIIIALIWTYFYNKAGARKLLVALLIVGSIILALLSVRQSAVWRDPLSFWSRPIARYPALVPLAFINRAMAKEDAGDLLGALQDYGSAIKLKPYATSYNNRGNLLNRLGRFNDAVGDFTLAIALESDYVFAYNNRAIAYAGLGKWQAAIQDLFKAIELDPNLAQPYKNLSDIYRVRGDNARARATMIRAIELGYESNKQVSP